MRCSVACVPLRPSTPGREMRFIGTCKYLQPHRVQNARPEKTAKSCEPKPSVFPATMRQRPLARSHRGTSRHRFAHELMCELHLWAVKNADMLLGGCGLSHV